MPFKAHERGDAGDMIANDIIDYLRFHGYTIEQLEEPRPRPALPDKHPKSCGYFTGETTPAGCQLLMRKHRAAIRVATDAQMLANHCKKSLDAGPMSKDPSREAGLWRALNEALDQFRSEFDVR